MKIEIPEVVMIPRDKIKCNPYNPNIVSADIFNSIVENIEDFGFVQPIVVAPLPKKDKHDFQIIDGEHRFDALCLLEVPEIPCVVKKVSLDQQKFQTVKMNRLRGKMDMKKFTALVENLMEKYSFEEVAEHLAFTDPTELEQMIESTRESLPTDELKEEFDRAKNDIKTVDDLSIVLNRLFTSFGSTLPANFMILDFGGKDHIWIRMKARDYKKILGKAREVLSHGYTFDSFLSHVLSVIQVEKAINKYKTFLEEAKPDDGGETLLKD